MTYTQAAQTALDVQNAVNLGAIVHAFSEAIHAIQEKAHEIGRGTEFVNSHPIVTLFLDKLVDLNGREKFDGAMGLGSDFLEIYDAVRDIARG